MIGKKPNLTICIPSLGRSREAAKTLLALRKWIMNTNIQVVLINNNSNLDPYEQTFQIIDSCENFTYVNYTNNLGFGDSFIKLFKNCDSKYMLILSDEDEINELGVKDLAQLLAVKKPIYVSLARSSSKLSRKISLKKIGVGSLFSETIYISGKVINVDYCKKYLPALKKLIRDEIYADLYPQVILAIILQFNEKIFSSNLPIYRTRSSQTPIKGVKATPYDLPTERVYQFLSLLRCLEYLQKSGFIKRNLNYFITQNFIKINFFGRLYDSLLTIDKNIKVPLLISTQKTIFLLLIRNLIHVPLSLLKRIFQKI